MNGTFSQKSPSSGFLTRVQSAWLEALLLFGLGALAVVLHQSTRLPLNLPGRHGIEWMALLVLGRSLGRSRASGSITALGASVFSVLPIWGPLDDPFIWLIYLLPGLVMDFSFARLPRLTGSLAFLAGLGGLAHATKPLARWIINLATGFPYGSLLFGVLYPLATHLLFGMLGGFLGGMLALGIRRLGHSERP